MFKGGTLTILDLSWYSEYKPMVDMFVSACLYLAFFWNLFKNMPSILQGVSTGANVVLGLFEHDPSAMAVDNMYKEREKELRRASIDERYTMMKEGYTDKANIVKRDNIERSFNVYSNRNSQKGGKV